MKQHVDFDRLYWNVQGRVNCGKHAPYFGTDTWEWEQWSEVPMSGLIEWRRLEGKPQECETCHKHDVRETS